MLSPKDFTNELLKNDLGPVVEVPCSYLKSFLDYLWNTASLEVINPANEALVMGIASGNYLATGKIPIVAIQNSGLLNTLNALTSLNQIYDIPVFYITTWRGEGGKGHDAPEHDITGANMKKILQTFEIPYEIINEEIYATQIKSLVNKAKEANKPVALIIKKNTFMPYEQSKHEVNHQYEMSRYDAMKIMKENFYNNFIILSTTGFATRDSFSIKDTPDFYIVGSMGHIFSIALGIAPHTEKKVVIFDGDGSCLMHLGGLASFNPKLHRNILYIVFDNQSYESTGSQPSISTCVNFKPLAYAFKFPHFYEITKQKQLKSFLKKLKELQGSIFLHIKVKTNTSSAGKRVSDTYSCPQIKERFMEQF